MKLKYIIGLFLIVLISGCAIPETPPAEEVVEEKITPPAPEETPVTEEVVEETPVGADIQILRTGFDLEESTVKAGATVTFKNMDDRIHIINGIGGFFTAQRLEPENTFEFAFEEAGTYEVLDSPSKTRIKVTVK